jgi:hypothetical protein
MSHIKPRSHFKSETGSRGRRPVFRNLRQLVWSYFDPYVDTTARLTGYGLASMYELGGYDWRFSKRNVWKVERHLDALKKVRSEE